jgi:hypothetical protein
MLLVSRALISDRDAERFLQRILILYPVQFGSRLTFKPVSWAALVGKSSLGFQKDWTCLAVALHAFVHSGCSAKRQCFDQDAIFILWSLG